jgi:hypothetical protein
MKSKFIEFYQKGALALFVLRTRDKIFKKTNQKITSKDMSFQNVRRN